MNEVRLLLPRIFSQKIPHQVNVVEISERQARTLNKKYRKKNTPANVLSFRYGKDYGEILVCPEIIRREAKAQGNSYKYQMTWMILHGMIHFAGAHHEKSRRAAELVDSIEQKILKNLFK